MFTDWYGQQSCTAGRAAFITGQSPIRTGLTKVGLPGAEIGLGPEDPCDRRRPEIATAMRRVSSARTISATGTNTCRRCTASMNSSATSITSTPKRSRRTPTIRRIPQFKKKFGPRGVLKCKADGKGGQKIENTGALTIEAHGDRRRGVSRRGMDFINRKHKAGTPWFCYFNSTRMHVFTHLKKESQGKTGLGVYPDGMVEHDGHVGQLLKLIDDLGVADNTIVVYTTDNGAEVMTWPDGGATPFRGEKATNWEGAFRVPCVMRWPGVIKPGTVVNDICAHEDFMPTFAAAAGDTELVDRSCAKGKKLNGRNFKVHLDGDNLLPFLKGEEKQSPREGFLYWSDDGDLMAIRARDWKVVFMEQEHTGLAVWQRPSRGCECPSHSICAPIRSNAAMKASTTAAGSRSECS